MIDLGILLTVFQSQIIENHDLGVIPEGTP